MKVTSQIIKLILMNKYRFTNGYMVSSEVNIYSYAGNIADLLLYDMKHEKLIEIEIKISKSDLVHDIKKKKHEEYKKGSVYACISKFYYAVPSFLVEVCENFITEYELPYGIIEIKPDLFEIYSKDKRRNIINYSQDCCSIVKKGKTFYKGEIHEQQKHIFFKRISSEVVTRSSKVYFLQERYKLNEKS